MLDAVGDADSRDRRMAAAAPRRCRPITHGEPAAADAMRLHRRELHWSCHVRTTGVIAIGLKAARGAAPAATASRVTPPSVKAKSSSRPAPIRRARIRRA
jgi:hypothetical protein